MAKEFSKKFYDSKLWKMTRRAYIENRKSVDGGFCEHCHKELGYIVDHIVELTPENIHDANIALSFENFQYLCLECHNRKTFAKNERCYFDDEGNVYFAPMRK